MTKKITKKVIFILVLMIFGGLGGVIADRYFFPYLSTTKVFSKYAFLKKGSENITVINKTEQITVREETSISKITSQVSSSVVNIISYQDKDAKSLASKLPASAKTKNTTGIIVTGDGMIMTYVLGKDVADMKYKVMTHDGNVHDATLLGIDSYSNLAFLKINANNLSAASFADSDSTKSGEKIIAVANSLESYANRYASGLISDLDPSFNLSGMSVSSSEKLEGIYETDIDYKDYFVGGPVVDYSGQVVGMVGSIERNNEQSFFLIPANKIRTVINRAIAKELEKNPILGIYYIPISKTYVIENDLSVSSGAIIHSDSGQQGLAVLANSPAQKAGLKLGDIITAVGGKEITSHNSLSELLYAFKKGEQIELTVLRDGQSMAVKVDL